VVETLYTRRTCTRKKRHHIYTRKHKQIKQTRHLPRTPRTFHPDTTTAHARARKPIVPAGFDRSMEAAPSPDLSLHISLPSSGAPTPAAAGLGAGGDPWRRLNGSTASTELSLSPAPTQEDVDVLPWRLRQIVASSATAGASTSVPVTVPTLPLDAAAPAESARPIRGIPLYSRPTPGHHPFHHPKAGLYSPYQSTAWPSSTSPAAAPPPSVDPATAFLSQSPYHRMLSSTGRLHGVLADTLRGYGALGLGGQPFGLASSRYMPRLPGSRRSMRAPRMRWTSSLHARFVHAVELLGGHERESSPHRPQFRWTFRVISCPVISTWIERRCDAQVGA
jgi:hypothetical protein